MLEILDGFSLVLVLIYQHSKLVFLQVTLNFELEYVNEIVSSRHYTSNFAHSFDFHCPNNYAIRINLWWTVSLWCKLLCKLSIYTLKSDQ